MQTPATEIDELPDRLRTKQHRRTGETGRRQQCSMLGTDEQAREMRREIENLRERIRVLERIATDGNHALASQIDELRDLQEIEDRTMPQGATR